MRRIIDGFECEMVPNADREGSNCYVTKDNASNSLALLQDMGEFDEPNALGNKVKIKQATLDKIEAWAIENGY